SRQATPGRTEPLRVTIMTGDGVEHEAVMKISAGIELGAEALMNEMLGSLIAADAGLAVQEPFFVELTAEFCASIPFPAMQARLVSSCPLAFASLDAGKQWRGWNATDRISPSRFSQASSNSLGFPILTEYTGTLRLPPIALNPRASLMF